jgi:VIT1/CCC1 family predicted Fe2+/Mn2+ transporter
MGWPWSAAARTGKAVPMATENRALVDAHGHEGGHHHRDVSGGWLRPAVFGAMDGLVTNVSLIAGVVGGGMVARLTDRPFWRGAARQLLLGACAVAITYLIGVAVGHVAG